MSDQTLLPAPEEPPPPPPAEQPAVAAAPKRPERNLLLPLLSALGFLILAGAIIYLWQNPVVPSETTANTQSLQTVQQRLSDLGTQVNKLEQRPAPDTGKITARLDALEHRMDDLDHKIADLDHKVVDIGDLGSRIDKVSARVESLSGRDQSAIDAAKQQIDALTSRLTTLEANVGNVQALSTRLSRMAKVQEASFALEAGRPIGDVPGAPDALARYAHQAPPTPGQLQLRFHEAEQAALAAPPPDETNPSFVERAWDRAQDLMTIRRGNQVVIGNPVAVTLNKAQTALDAGDLSGAVTAVETLKGAPAQAMASWLDDAKGLLAARAALDQMAGQA